MSRADRALSSAAMVANVLGVLLGLSLVGSGVYALVAVMLEWPPADRVIELLVLYGFGGGVNLIEAWAVTWFHLLVLQILPVALGALVVNLRTRDAKPALEGSAAARFRALCRKRLAWGLVVSATTLALYVGLALAPSALAPIAFVVRLALVLAPFAVLLGPSLVLDALLAPTVRVVAIGSISDAPAIDGRERRSLNGVYTVELEEASSLHVGSQVSILSTRIFATVLSATPLDPYR